MYATPTMKALLACCALLAHGASASVLPRASCPQPATTASSFPAPRTDPFYDIPSNIGSYANGAVVRTRGIANTTVFGTAVNTRQVFYRTTNRRGYYYYEHSYCDKSMLLTADCSELFSFRRSTNFVPYAN